MILGAALSGVRRLSVGALAVAAVLCASGLDTAMAHASPNDDLSAELPPAQSAESGPTISQPTEVITIGQPTKQQLVLSPGARVLGAPALPEGLVLTSTGLLAGTAAPNASGEIWVRVLLADASTSAERDILIGLTGTNTNTQTRTQSVPWGGGRFGQEERCPATHPWLRNEVFPGHSLPKGIAAVTHGGLGISVSGTKITDGSGRAIGVKSLSTTNLGAEGLMHLVLHCTNDQNLSWTRG